MNLKIEVYDDFGDIPNKVFEKERISIEIRVSLNAEKLEIILSIFFV